LAKDGRLRASGEDEVRRKARTRTAVGRRNAVGCLNIHDPNMTSTQGLFNGLTNSQQTGCRSSNKYSML
jgi:hypothetical protein